MIGIAIDGRIVHTAAPLEQRPALGQLMDMQRLGARHQRGHAETARRSPRAAGAWGAKLSGAGGGDIVFWPRRTAAPRSVRDSRGRDAG